MKNQKVNNVLTLAFSTALIGAVGVAQAETAAEATARAKTALKAGRIPEACAAFEESQKLAASIETELSLADCYAQDGKLMTASKLYASIAARDTNAKRKATSLKKATELEGRAPSLRFAISPTTEGTVITVDGVVVPSTGDVKVDLGSREVVVTAPGMEGKATAALDKEGKRVDVIVRLKSTVPPVEVKPPVDVKPPDTTPPVDKPAVDTTPPADLPVASETKPDVMPQAKSSSRKTYGIVALASGAGLLVGSGVLLGIAQSKFSTEKDLCPDAKCPNAQALARAEALASNGTAYRNIGIGVGIGGVALLATGAYLMLTGNESESPVTFQVNRDGGAFAFTGRF